jgi:hypothetical protein
MWRTSNFHFNVIHDACVQHDGAKSKGSTSKESPKGPRLSRFESWEAHFYLATWFPLWLPNCHLALIFQPPLEPFQRESSPILTPHQCPQLGPFQKYPKVEHPFLESCKQRSITAIWSNLTSSACTSSFWKSPSILPSRVQFQDSRHLSADYKVDVPKSNTTIICTPIFEWYVVRCGSKNNYQKDMFHRHWTMCSK